VEEFSKQSSYVLETCSNKFIQTQHDARICCYCDYQIYEDDIGEEVAHMKEKRNACKVLLQKTEIRRSLGRYRHTCKANISRKKRVNDLFKLSRHQLRTVVAFLMGHAPVKKHLNSMGLFDGSRNCRFCKAEAERMYRIICCCEVLAHQCYNFFVKFFAKPKYISTASLKDMCLL
jgi:hypothetical protein